MRAYPTPFPVNVDAYQSSHFRMIPPGMMDFQVSQGTYRKPLQHVLEGVDDHRLMSAGMRAYVDLCLMDTLTMDDVDRSARFFSTYGASMTPPYYQPYPFPEQAFRRVVTHYGGRPPIVVMAQADGQSHYVGEPHMQVWCGEKGLGELVGWIESDALPYQWSSSIVATRGRMRKDAYMGVYRAVYPDKSTKELLQMIAHKFQDFGRRGGSASQITGIAYLYNWLGSDTCDAAYVAQMYYNDEEPFGACSIAAAAHRSVTPWPSEDQAIAKVIEEFGAGFIAFVADSYDYEACLRKLGGYAKIVRVAGGFLVGRPDSGDVIQTVLDGLRIFEEYFGLDDAGTAEAGGMKVLSHCGILQGDGVSDLILFRNLFPAIISAGYSPINVAIGMGQHNHMAARSDTEDGYKNCVVGTGNLKYPDFRILEPGYAKTMKGSRDSWKRSIPCPIGLRFDDFYDVRVYPVSINQLKAGDTGDMRVVYDGRPGAKDVTPGWEKFTKVRERAWESWESLDPVPPCDTFDPRIRAMQDRHMSEINP